MVSTLQMKSKTKDENTVFLLRILSKRLIACMQSLLAGRKLHVAINAEVKTMKLFYLLILGLLLQNTAPFPDALRWYW